MASRSYSVQRTDAYEEDLDEAVAYYLRVAGAASATRFLDEYDEMCELLSSTPGYGVPLGATGYRWRATGVFVTVYSVEDDAKMVTLNRLFYIRSDWKVRLLGADD